MLKLLLRVLKVQMDCYIVVETIYPSHVVKTYSMVQSRVNYCVEVYGNTTWNILQPLHVACIRVLRTLQGLSRFISVKDMYIAYDILPVHLLHKFCIAKLIHNCLNNTIEVPTV